MQHITDYDTINKPILTKGPEVAQIDEAQVLLILNNFPKKLSAGTDQISCFLINKFAYTFSKPLTFIHNLCLKTAKFRIGWKTGRVFPI